jgi:hypothetical protein
MLWVFVVAYSQKQHSAGRHVVPLGHIIFIARQPVVLLSAAYLAGETTDVNFIIFGLTRSVLEPTIYHTRGEHDNLYTTDEPTIYHTRGEHDNLYTIISLNVTCSRHDIAEKLPIWR